jgi:hypothetical protein
LLAAAVMVVVVQPIHQVQITWLVVVAAADLPFAHI